MLQGLKFAVIVCGYLSSYPNLQDLLQRVPKGNAVPTRQSRRWGKAEDAPSEARAELCRLFDIPTMHIMGEKDRVTPLFMNLEMAAKFKDPVLVQHPGGHSMPFNTTCMRPLIKFLRQFVADDSTSAADMDHIVVGSSLLCEECGAWDHPTYDGFQGGRHSQRFYCQACWDAWQRKSKLHNTQSDDAFAIETQGPGQEIDVLEEDPDLQLALLLST